MSRIDEAVEAVDRFGKHGATWKELADLLNLSHSQTSNALSIANLRKRLALLTDVKREDCGVYVTPGNIDGRDVSYRQPKPPKANTVAEMVQLLPLINRRLDQAERIAAGRVGDLYYEGRRDGLADLYGEVKRIVEREQ